MEVKSILFYLVSFIAFTSFIQRSCAEDESKSHIAQYDDYWKRKEIEAKNAAAEAYHPDPEDVHTDLSKNVDEALETSNKTGRSLDTAGRRGLGTGSSECLAANPIDACWRCKPNWADHRRDLADCALGFGKKTLGGRKGRLYFVTDPSDDDVANPRPGTLRYGVTRNEPLWIVFKTSMKIKLKEELIMTSYKTLDGRGVEVHIADGAGIMIQFAKHVIIHGIHIHNIKPAYGGMIMSSEDHVGLRTESDGDAISIFGSTNVWIDHVSMTRSKDGLIDVVQGSTAITISNNRFWDHNHVMLLGASDSYPDDKIMQVTIAFNLFGKNLVQRMPWIRYGTAHIVNNDYDEWQIYAIGGNKGPTIISQGNRFKAPEPHYLKQITKRDMNVPMSEWMQWKWSSRHDIMLNGAFFAESGIPGNAHIAMEYKVKSRFGEFVPLLTHNAGALNCIVGQPC